MIGVFDSGVGGLSVLKALRAELPHEDFIYIADSGHAPYGERDEAHVTRRALALARHLADCNVKALVIACNTATAAAIAALRSAHPGLPIIGVEPALKPAAAASKTRRIGVMATRSTLESQKFRSLLASQAGASQFILQPCDGLADAIEHSASNRDATKVIAYCQAYTGAMGIFGTQPGEIDTLVLGCTHFPFAIPHLKALLGPEVQLVDTALAVARQTARLLSGAAPQPDIHGAVGGAVGLFSTGDPAALQAAAHCWLGLSGQARHLHT